MECRRDFRVRPGPDPLSMVVEDADHRVATEGGIERNHIPDGAHAPIRSARAPEERLSRILEDLAGAQRGEALPFDGPPVGLALVAEERASTISDLEGDAHAKEYLLYNISSAPCRRSASSSWSRRTRGMSAPSRGP